MPAPRNRPAVLLAVVIVPMTLAALVGVALTWPTGPAQAEREITEVEVGYHRATVTATSLERCEGSTETRLPDGEIPDFVDCVRVEATVTAGEFEGNEVSVYATTGLELEDIGVGTRIVVEQYPLPGEPDVWAWHDFDRAFPLVALALAFALVVVLVAGMRGFRALVGLAFAFAVIGMYLLPALLRGENPLVVALCGSVVIMVAVLYLAHGLSVRTSTALLGTMLGLTLTTGLGALAAQAARLSTVSTEESFRLAGILGEHGVDTLRGLFLSGIVLAGLGVLNDVTITQASAVWELHESDPGMSRRALFGRGMRIGRDHIASTVYTIVFAYAGASLPVLLLLQVYQLPLARTLTSGHFAEEIVRTLVGSIGLVVAIPLTTALAALVVTAVRTARHAQVPTTPGAGHRH